MTTLIYIFAVIFALIGFITAATIAYRARWLIDPATWKSMGPWLGLKWGIGGGK